MPFRLLLSVVFIGASAWANPEVGAPHALIQWGGEVASADLFPEDAGAQGPGSEGEGGGILATPIRAVAHATSRASSHHRRHHRLHGKHPKQHLALGAKAGHKGKSHRHHRVHNGSSASLMKRKKVNMTNSTMGATTTVAPSRSNTRASMTVPRVQKQKASLSMAAAVTAAPSPATMADMLRATPIFRDSQLVRGRRSRTGQKSKLSHVAVSRTNWASTVKGTSASAMTTKGTSASMARGTSAGTATGASASSSADTSAQSQKITWLQTENTRLVQKTEKLAVGFRKLDATYRTEQVQEIGLKRLLEANYARMAKLESSRDQLKAEQKEQARKLSNANEKNSLLSRALELENRTDANLRNELKALREQLVSRVEVAQSASTSSSDGSDEDEEDEKESSEGEAQMQAELRNTTRKLALAVAKGKKLHQHAKMLGRRLKKQEEENYKLAARNEKLEHLEKEQSAQIVELQHEVQSNGKGAQSELQQFFDAVSRSQTQPLSQLPQNGSSTNSSA